MLLVQMTGLSGAGKTTIAIGAQKLLTEKGFKVEIIDGDEYRKVISRDLGFSEKDRKENIRRLAFIGKVLARNDVIAIISAINPYEEVRNEIKEFGAFVRTIWIDCPLQILIERDAKGLYKKALLPDNSEDKILNLTGVNDVYEIPLSPHLIINTHSETEEKSISRFTNYILKELESSSK